MKKYEIIDHTADVAIKVCGKTIKDLFINSARGLFCIITDNQVYCADRERKIKLAGDVLEDLLVSWLNELIFLFYSYHFLTKYYNIKIKNNSLILKGTLEGTYLKEDVLKIKTEVKAATYHNIKIEKNNVGFMVTIVFDL